MSPVCYPPSHIAFIVEMILAAGMVALVLWVFRDFKWPRKKKGPWDR